MFLASSLITTQNLLVVSHTVHAHVGGPKKSGDAGVRPIGTGACLTLYIHAFTRSYHTKFRRFQSNRLGVARKSQKVAVAPPSWDGGVANP